MAALRVPIQDIEVQFVAQGKNAADDALVGMLNDVRKMARNARLVAIPFTQDKALLSRIAAVPVSVLPGKLDKTA